MQMLLQYPRLLGIMFTWLSIFDKPVGTLWTIYYTLLVSPGALFEDVMSKVVSQMLAFR